MRPKRKRRIMMRVEGTETETSTDESNKNCDATEDTFDPNKIVKSEDEDKVVEDTHDGDSTVNGTNNSLTENELPVSTKVEDVSTDNTEDENRTRHLRNKCAKISNNQNALEDTKTPFKICRLCLVFVDDSFIPLEKVMVMLQIVLPEVVREHFYIFFFIFSKSGIVRFISKV